MCSENWMRPTLGWIWNVSGLCTRVGPWDRGSPKKQFINTERKSYKWPSRHLSICWITIWAALAEVLIRPSRLLLSKGCSWSRPDPDTARPDTMGWNPRPCMVLASIWTKPFNVRWVYIYFSNEKKVDMSLGRWVEFLPQNPPGWVSWPTP